MIVVFDTNVWYSQLGLKSPPGAAVRFFLRQHGAKVAIPEVVRLEVTQNLSKRLLQHIKSIHSEYRQLLTAFGKLREIVLPSEADVQFRIAELFDSLGVEQIDVPFSLESARSSFLKTILKLPPSHTTQQFKDGVLWADCLSLLERDEVVLVTGDSDFYEGQKTSNGLARTLREEAEGRPNPIRVLPALSDLLDALRQPIAINHDKLQQAFFERHHESVFGTLERNGFELGVRTEVQLKPFATEDSSVLFVEFSMSFDCTDVRGEGRTNVVLRLKGDGAFVPSKDSFERLRNFGEHLQFRMPDGTESEIRNHVLFVGGFVFGHKEVTEVTRHPLADI